MIAADAVADGMEAEDPLQEQAQLCPRDAIFLIVASVDIGVQEEFEELVFARAIAGEEGGEFDGETIGIAAQFVEVVGAGFVAGEDQEDGLVGVLGGLVEQKGSDIVFHPLLVEQGAVEEHTGLTGETIEVLPGGRGDAGEVGGCGFGQGGDSRVVEEDAFGDYLIEKRMSFGETFVDVAGVVDEESRGDGGCGGAAGHAGMGAIFDQLLEFMVVMPVAEAGDDEDVIGGDFGRHLVGCFVGVGAEKDDLIGMGGADEESGDGVQLPAFNRGEMG